MVEETLTSDTVGDAVAVVATAVALGMKIPAIPGTTVWLVDDSGKGCESAFASKEAAPPLQT